MKETALNTQVGGSHYKDMVIQPVEFIEKNNQSKNGIEDLKKAKHYLEILIDMESNEEGS